MDEEAEVFIDEALELFDEVEMTLLQLKDNLDDKDLLNKLFRDLYHQGGGADDTRSV